MKRLYKCGDCNSLLEPDAVLVRQVTYLRGTLGHTIVRSQRTGYFCDTCAKARTHEWRGAKPHRKDKGTVKVEGA